MVLWHLLVILLRINRILSGLAVVGVADWEGYCGVCGYEALHFGRLGLRDKRVIVQ